MLEKPYFESLVLQCMEDALQNRLPWAMCGVGALDIDSN
jgi:hypothetical protein